MQIGDIEYKAADRVATITLNRPEKFNAITERMPGDLAAAVEQTASDELVRAMPSPHALAFFRWTRSPPSTRQHLSS